MTDSDNSEQAALRGQVLKTDARGRVRSTAAQRVALLEQFERSGLSGPKFAAVAGIKYQTLMCWRGQQRRSQTQPSFGQALGSCGTPAPIRWMEAVLAGAANEQASGLKVRWKACTMMEIGQASQVPLAAALLLALEQQRSLPC